MNIDEIFDRVMEQESVYYEPAYSPWGEVQNYTLIAEGIFEVKQLLTAGFLF